MWQELTASSLKPKSCERRLDIALAFLGLYQMVEKATMLFGYLQCGYDGTTIFSALLVCIAILPVFSDNVLLPSTLGQ
jgi:hypothetical protein